MPAAPPAGFGLTVGAENVEGSAGAQTAPTFPGTGPTQGPARDEHPGRTGRHVHVQLRGQGESRSGTGTVRTDLTTPLVRGTTIDVDAIQITN